MRLHRSSIRGTVSATSSAKPHPSAGERRKRAQRKHLPLTRNLNSQPRVGGHPQVDVEEAARKAKKKSTPSRPSDRLTSIVYVGNIESFITEQRLTEFFAPCGKVKRIQLRCSRGQAITLGVAIPPEVLSPRDRQYATVEFEGHESTKAAVALSGQCLDGCKLLVSSSPADLPEVQEIVLRRMNSLAIRTRYRKTMLLQLKRGKPISAQATEPTLASGNKPPEQKRERYQAFGVTFAKCVL